MRFVRYGEAGQERPGVLDAEGRVRDLSGVVEDLSGAVLGELPQVDPETLPMVEGTPRLGIPVAGVGKMVCIGLDYADHAAEAGLPIPAEPIVFLKALSALTGPDDPVLLPRGSTHSDWEVELGVVIGRTAKYVSEADALSHVAGYTIVNDVSERHFQTQRGGQWTKGKSCDTVGPVGPWLVTPDEVPDPQALALSCDVNGERRQTGSTASMIFGVAHVISYLSHMMSLRPGDIIATGTPPGVGSGMKPPQFLKPGDVMELTVEGLGRQRQEVRSD